MKMPYISILETCTYLQKKHRTEELAESSAHKEAEAQRTPRQRSPAQEDWRRDSRRPSAAFLQLKPCVT